MKKRVLKKWISRYNQHRKRWENGWKQTGKYTKFNKHRQFYAWLAKKGYTIQFDS